MTTTQPTAIVFGGEARLALKSVVRDLIREVLADAAGNIDPPKAVQAAEQAVLAHLGRVDCSTAR